MFIKKFGTIVLNIFAVVMNKDWGEIIGSKNSNISWCKRI